MSSRLASAVGAPSAWSTSTALYRKRRNQSFVCLSTAASSLSTTPTYSNPFFAGQFDELLVYATGISIAGSSTGLQALVQLGDETNAVWLTIPGTGTISLTTQPGTSMLGLQSFTGFGNIVRVGLLLTTNSYTGGTITVTAKVKG